METTKVNVVPTNLYAGAENILQFVPGGRSLECLSNRQLGFRTARSAITLVTGLAENSMHEKGVSSKYCAVQSAFNSAS